MSQNDFNIANQGFPSFRSDLNSALQALASNSSGTSAPATTYAYMWWYDSTNDILKMRNADNDAWIDFATLDQATDTFTITTDNIDGLTATATELNKLDGITNNAASYFTASGAFSNRNKIINGAMVIDQRNNGSAVTPTGSTYTLDRWRLGASAASKVSVQRSSAAPTGFSRSTLITSLSAYTMGAGEEINFGQRIEGFNTADLGWGTSGAQPVTLSFWVRSSLTGTFGGALKNGSGTNSYIFSYSVSAADTWEYKTLTIAGATSGSWGTDNTVGIVCQFSVSAGTSLLSSIGWASGNLSGVTGQVNLAATNGATLYITGVQLEVGDTATPFEHRSYGDELALCQRYYYKTDIRALSLANATTTSYSYREPRSVQVSFPVTMRVEPTATRTVNDENLSGGVYLRASNNTVTCVPASYAGDIPSGAYSYGGAIMDAEL